MSKGTGIAAGQILGFPDFVQAVVLVANTGQAFDTPAGMGSVLFSMNADFYARYGSTAAAVPTTSSTAATGSELNPTARNIGSSLTTTGISLISESAAKGSLAWFKPA